MQLVGAGLNCGSVLKVLQDEKYVANMYDGIKLSNY